jgi:hypothetical protein
MYSILVLREIEKKINQHKQNLEFLIFRIRPS